MSFMGGPSLVYIPRVEQYPPEQVDAACSWYELNLLAIGRLCHRTVIERAWSKPHRHEMKVDIEEESP
jgi:hypothetical protein